MSDREWDCADMDALASLRADEGGASDAAKERVFDRLAERIGMVHVPPPPVDAKAALTDGVRFASTSAGSAGHRVALTLAFAFGGGVGALVHASLAPPPAPTIVYVDRPAAHVTASSVAGGAEIPRRVTEGSSSRAMDPHSSTSVAPPSASERAAMSGGSSAARSDVASLAAQQALLDAARAEFGRGDNGATLRLIAAHQRRYPDSILSEEREALAVKALVAQGKWSEAKARGARFNERYPRSVLLPAVLDSLATIP